MDAEKNKDKNKNTNPTGRPDQQTESVEIEEITNVISSLP